MAERAGPCRRPQECSGGAVAVVDCRAGGELLPGLVIRAGPESPRDFPERVGRSGLALAADLVFQIRMQNLWERSLPAKLLATSRPSSRASSAPTKWRKAAGVEPAPERMPSPTGFEARPRHRARLPSIDSLRPPAGAGLLAIADCKAYWPHRQQAGSYRGSV